MRSFVPFEALWSMPIEVPYSLVLRVGKFAWSCGQLALDADSSVIGPDDLGLQSNKVCDYIEEILERGALPVSSVRRMLLYYVDRRSEERGQMLEIFRQRFGDAVLLDPIPVPYFYYDGLSLEVDVFCAMDDGRSISCSRTEATLELVENDGFIWASLDTSDAALETAAELLKESLEEIGAKPADVLSEHLFAPSHLLSKSSDRLGRSGHSADSGALVDVGHRRDRIGGIFTFVRGASGPGSSEVEDADDLRIVSRRRGPFTWIHARSLDQDLDLVDQTKQIMGGIERVFDRLGMTFADVVKSTTHYVASSSPEELHDNMRVRNSYYAKPGPASTGLPVFGFSDPASRIVVDVTAMSDPDDPD